MTFQQIVKRIETVCTAHKQIRSFKRGLVQDFLADKTIPYAAAFLQDNTGTIDPGLNQVTFNFRLFFLDLVHVSEDTKGNELDVLSDMISVAMGIVGQLTQPSWQDWKISGVNQVQLLVENDGDMNAGCYVDMIVALPWGQDICVEPSTLPLPPFEPPTPEDMKLVYDVKYVADGSEGLILDSRALNSVLNAVTGKKILLVTREYSPLYPVSNLPGSTEFVWDDTLVELGLPTMAGERFLFLYRTY